MATLRLDNGRVLTDLQNIAAELDPLHIQLKQWPVGNDPHLCQLLVQEQLTDTEKEEVLTGLDGYFQRLQQTSDYQSRDLIVLHPNIPTLDDLLTKFDRIHTHADDEVRYILDGAGVFGFVRPDGSQVELTVEAEECINVPAKTEHWFYLTPQRRIKAIRYFASTEGWVPQYTGAAIHTRAVLT